MVVLIAENVPPALRGKLTRWMIEPKAGVFVGKLSATVRQNLWKHACQNAREGGCLMLWSADTEQGFKIDFWAKTSRWITDWDGLQLVTRPKKP